MQFRAAPEGLVPPTEQPKASKTHHELVLKLKTIAPICGGGAKATEPDFLQPVRPRAVRNGIAHWWWRLNRARYSSPEALWQAYSRVFGARAGTVGGGTAKLQVCECSHNRQSMKPVMWWPFSINQRGSFVLAMGEPIGSWSYALFQARGTLVTGPNQPTSAAAQLQPWLAQALLPGPEVGPGLLPWPAQGLSAQRQQALDGLFGSPSGWPHRLIAPGLELQLALRWPRAAADDPQSQSDEVSMLRALRLWLVLGQFGGRGSRGMGAFIMESGQLDDAPVPEDWGRLESLQCLLRDDDNVGLPGWGWYVSPALTPRAATESLIGKYRQFRQMRLRNTQENRPSRSLWPDADTHRVLQGVPANAAHQAIHPGSNKPGGPRLLLDLTLGGPVHAEFNAQGQPARNEPSTVGVAPWVDGKNARFPSPLRLRAVRKQNGDWASLALCMPHRVDLKGLQVSVTWPGHQRILAPAEWQGRDNATGSALNPDVHEAAFGPALYSAFDLQNRDMPDGHLAFAAAMRNGKGSAPVAFLKYLRAMAGEGQP